MALYCYDLETYPNYFLAMFQDVKTDEFFSFTHDHLPELISWMENPARQFISWNGAYFDDLIIRHIRRKLTPTQSGMFRTKVSITPQEIAELATLIITTDKSNPTEVATLNAALQGIRWANEGEQLTSIDIKALLDPMPSLKKTEVRLRFENVEDLPYDPALDLTEEQKQVVHDYCKNDVSATRHVYLTEALPHLQLRRHLQDKFKVTALESLSEPRTAERILMNLYMHKTGEQWRDIKEKAQENFRNHTTFGIPIQDFVPDWIEFKTQYLQELLQTFKHMELPVKKDTGHPIGDQLKQRVIIGDMAYQMGVGGLHSTEKSIVIDVREDDTKHLIMTDIASMYPQTMIRDSLRPIHLGHDWIDIYEQIRDLRLRDKRAGKKMESNALKIILNATFGKLASQYSPFYDPHLLTRITVTGQLALLMLIEAFHLNHIQVISANTDGVLVHINESQLKTFEQCKTDWSKQTKYELEDEHFDMICIRDVNSYIAHSPDGSLKQKGKFTKPNLKKDVQAYAVTQMAIDYLLNEITPENSYKAHDFNIYDFLYSFSATRDFEVFLESEGLRDKLTKTNRWYKSTTNQNQLIKFGGKNQNWNRIPNGADIQIFNRVPDESIPDDLNLVHYFAEVYKLVKTITDEDAAPLVDSNG